MTLRRLIEESPAIDLSSAVMRRSSALSAGVFDEGIRQGYDIDLWLRLTLRGDTIVLRDIPSMSAPRRRAPGGQDGVEELESVVSILERFGQRHLLDAPTRTALRVRLMRLIDRLEIEQARCRMHEGHLDAARFHLSCARQPSWRVRLAIAALRVAPRLAAAVYRRVPSFTS